MNCFANKKVLITGNTGFKGSWLSLVLSELGAFVYGFSDKLQTFEGSYPKVYTLASDCQHLGDIKDLASVESVVQTIQPDFIFHLAAQSITLKSFRQPIDTIGINTLGTAHVLEAVRKAERACTVVVVTSDKCYKNNHWPWGYREIDILAGDDPYSASKSMAELVVNSYYQSFFKDSNEIKVCSCRAGNVIGGGDWNENRLTPDCIKTWIANEKVLIREPSAIRPWNYVLDVIAGYLKAATALQSDQFHGESFNFGPDEHAYINVLQVVKSLYGFWGGEGTGFQLEASAVGSKEHLVLKLSSEKAKDFLQWAPKYSLNQCLESTILWYKKALSDPESAENISRDMVKEFLSAQL